MVWYKFSFITKNNLIPAIIQEDKTGAVLMLGYMNADSWQKTITTGFVYFWSRSRQKLWRKGEVSGNELRVVAIYTDCDQDTLLLKVELLGDSICHQGYKSCFQERIK